NGPAFRIDDRAACALKIEDSIFSHPDKAPAEKCDEPDLIRQTSAADLLVRFEGRHNCYHNLNALWVRRLALCTELDEFRALVREAKGAGDIGSAQIGKDIAIWAAPAPWKEESLREAYRLLPDVPAVRGEDGRALGFEKCLDVSMALPPLLAREADGASKLKENEKVVDPEGVD